MTTETSLDRGAVDGRSGRSDASASATAAAAVKPIELRRLRLPAEGVERSPAATELTALIDRGAIADDRLRASVRSIVDEVRTRGEAAIRDANDRFGGGAADRRLLVEPRDLRAARDRLAAEDRRALEQAIDHVRTFAETQRPATTRTTTAPGIEIERRWLPLDRVGCYVPGGSAPYPSSLVMTVVPALVAGVGTIVVASPADRHGAVHPVLLGAAGLLGVDSFLVAGGAQAVAALAFGFDPEAPDEAGLAGVDRIVGPGNAWVTAAKLEIADRVGIDLPAGPSEGMVLADDAADPRTVAADLVTQAEHGIDSPAILVTTSATLADQVEAEVRRLVERLDRSAILRRSLDAHGRIVIADTLEGAVAFVDRYAPEHLSIDTRHPDDVAARVRHAGSIFVGRWAPESAGDYATGANHVLPTGGLARSSGALSVEQFGRYTQIQRIDRSGLEAIRSTVGRLAGVEGLTAHRHAIEARFRDDDDNPSIDAEERP